MFSNLETNTLYKYYIKYNIMDSLSSSPSTQSTFLQSNSIITKFVFLILVVIVFVILFRLGMFLLAWFYSPKKDPYIVRGLIDGNYPINIPQDPQDSDAVPLLRSNNDNSGAAFTYSFWLFVNEFGVNNSKFYHVFSKGSDDFDDQNLAKVNNAPGVYLGKTGDPAPSVGNANDLGLTLRVIMNSVKLYDGKTEVNVDNIPVKKWFHVAIRLQNTILDVYVNGAISGRILLSNVPKQNYDDILIGHHGGFPGKMSDLRYYNKSLNIFEIEKIVNDGPTLTASKFSKDAQSYGNYNYLGYNWYSEKY